MGIKNALRMTVLFAVLVAALGGLGYFFGGVAGLVLGLVFAGLMNLGTYWFSDRIVLRMYRARELSLGSDLHAMVGELSERAGVPEPGLYIMDSSTPNAFATGRNPKNSAVCVTSGLLENLSRDEIEGVLAHEISHIKNRDTLIQAVAGTLAGAISIMAQMLFYSSLGEENRNPALLFGGMLLAPIAASIIRMAISRSREFAADGTAAQITEPVKLADALRRIESAVDRNPMQRGSRGTSHMFIINPFRKDALARLFSTHPPTEERIARLERISN